MKVSAFRVTGSVASLASCLVLFGGVANAQATISHTGEDSTNKISIDNSCEVTVKNDNNIVFNNTNHQSANSGQAEATNNDGVGSVSTGNSSNSNTVSFIASIDNSSSPSCFKREATPTPGQGGGGSVVTPAETASTPTPAGGRGAGSVAVVTPQVAAVPVGGVGAGEGSPAYLAGVVAITTISGALAGRRLQKSFKTQF